MAQVVDDKASGCVMKENEESREIKQLKKENELCWMVKDNETRTESEWGFAFVMLFCSRIPYMI